MQHCSTLCILYTICPLFGLDSRPQNKKGKISDCSVEKLTCNYLLSAIWPLPFNKVVMCNNQFSPVEQPLTSLFVLSCQPSALQWVEMHILVVGAGPGGLVSGRYVLQLPRERWDTTLTIVEKSTSVGATWNGKESSPVYRDLHTNLPKEVMAFPDLDFEEESKSFIHHTSVRKYLRQYADKFNLQKVKIWRKEMLQFYQFFYFSTSSLRARLCLWAPSMLGIGTPGGMWLCCVRSPGQEDTLWRIWWSSRVWGSLSLGSRTSDHS